MEITQYDVILAHLKLKGHITSMEAIKKYSITRLSAIIYTLRSDGYIIKSIHKTGKSRKYGWRTNYVDYILLENNNENV